MLRGISTVKIFVYHYLTFGLYFLYWCNRSRSDINASARQVVIPSTWLLIVPFANYWWIWKYANALEHVSYGRIKTVDTFCFYLIGTSIGFFLLQFISNFVPSDDSDTILAILAIAAVITIFTSIGGLAFFCSVMQHKISRLKTAK